MGRREGLKMVCGMPRDSRVVLLRCSGNPSLMVTDLFNLLTIVTKICRFIFQTVNSWVSVNNKVFNQEQDF